MATESPTFTYKQFAEQIGNTANIPVVRENTPRVDNALQFAFDKIATGEREHLTSSTMKALTEVYELEQIGDSQWTLEDLKAPKNIEEVRTRIMKSKFLPTDHPDFDAFIDIAQKENKEYWLSAEGDAWFEKINKIAYQNIAEQYPLQELKVYPEGFYRDNMIEGVHAIEQNVEDEYEDKKDTISLLNEIAFTTEPAQLVQWLLSPNTDKRLQSELSRALIFSELSASKEVRAHGIDTIIEKIQRTLNVDIFNHGQKEGSGQYKEFYGFFDNNTNEPLWVSDIDDRLSPEKLEQYKSTAHLKMRTHRMRYAPDILIPLEDGQDATLPIGNVMTHYRNKPNGTTLEKATRDAGLREMEVGDNFLEVSLLRDLGGFMFVTEGDPENLTFAIKKMLRERFNLTNTDIKDKNETAQSILQSLSFSYSRFFADFPQYKLKSSIEFIMVGLKRYYKNELEYGEQDPITHEYLGPAHGTYDEKRERFVGPKWFDPEVYEQDLGSEEVAEVTRERAKNKLHTMYQVPVEMLPGEFIQ